MMAGRARTQRNRELGQFLRNRRGRVRPEDVGLAPGHRRRTPGLRREEVAQLAGVGVTWYTWLEQGRPINASVEVLDAIARVLRMGSSERWHLYRLADLPGVPKPPSEETVPMDVVSVLDELDPVPAAVYNGKYDLLACNEAYGALFPVLIGATGIERNVLWQVYSCPRADSPVKDHDVCSSMVGTLRANYAAHLGDPEWTELIDALCAASTDFAEVWADHRLPDPQRRPIAKTFDCYGRGTVRVRASGFPVPPTLECRMVVYVPQTAADRAMIAELRELIPRLHSA